MEYYERLKLIRTGKNFTQEQVGAALGISKQQYSKYENGTHLMPLPYFSKVCNFLDISADYVLGLGKNKPYPPFE